MGDIIELKYQIINNPNKKIIAKMNIFSDFRIINIKQAITKGKYIIIK